MSFQVIYDQENHMIESHLQGPFDWFVMEKMVPEIAKLVTEKDCTRIMLDFQAANLDLSTYQIYMTPEELAAEFQKYGVDLRQLKRAMILVNKDKDYEFLETVSLNRQQMFRIFFDIEEAREWLKEEG